MGNGQWTMRADLFVHYSFDIVHSFLIFAYLKFFVKVLYEAAIVSVSQQKKNLRGFELLEGFVFIPHPVNVRCALAPTTAVCATVLRHIRLVLHPCQ